MKKDPLVLTKKLKGEDGHRNLSLRVKADLFTQLDVLSEQTGRSRNEVAIILLKYALDNCIIEDSSQNTE